jgi:flavodoxin
MNTLIIYDSQYGNTQKIADRIAETLQEFGNVRTVQAGEFQPEELEKVDLLVIGSPTQAWRATPPIRDFILHLDERALNHLSIAEFDTVLDMPRLIAGSAAETMAKMLRRMGAFQIVPAENFIVAGREGPLAAGELEHAARWALTLREKVVAEERLQKVFH